MRVYFTTVILLLFVSFSSCEVLNQAVPDVDTSFEKTFQIKMIYSNEGTTEAQVVDITESDEYNDFRDNVDGFELKKISYKIQKCNIPEDMYFEGSVICYNEEETQSVSLGTTKKDKLLDLEKLNGEQQLKLEAGENISTVLSWIENPGKFKVRSGFSLTNELGVLYPIDFDSRGSNFEVVVKFYLSVKTKL
jgi:hypothetical protein